MSANNDHSKVSQEIAFPEDRIKNLEEKIKNLETEKKLLEEDIKKAEKFLLSARVEEEELSNIIKEKKKEIDKTREEKPFMPCDIKGKAGRLHCLLVRYHEYKVCFLQKKQQVSMLNDHVDLYKIQVKKKDSQIKELKDNLNIFNKRIAVHMGFEEQEKKNKKIFAKADFLMQYYCEKKFDSSAREQDVPSDFSDEKENYNNFKKAKIRMDSDFSGEEGKDLHCFLRQARMRRNILKEYDESAKDFLKTLKLASKEHKAIFEKAEKEYKAYLDGAQDNYKNAMKLMGEILKSKELTKKEGCCMASSKNREEALHYEKEFYKAWDEINKQIIKQQIAKKDCKHDGNANISGALEEKRQEYLKVYNILTSWHASVPEHIWDNLAKHEKAFELIYELTTKTLLEKKSAMESALTSWIELSIKEVFNRIDEENKYADCVMLLEKQIAYAEKNKAERVDAVLRGEPYAFFGKGLYKIIIDVKSLCHSPQEATDAACRVQQQTVQQQSLCQFGANNIVQEDICAQAESACVYIEDEDASSGCQAQQQTMQQQSPCQRK